LNVPFFSAEQLHSPHKHMHANIKHAANPFPIKQILQKIFLFFSKNRSISHRQIP
jgi:hypothetical protein